MRRQKKKGVGEKTDKKTEENADKQSAVGKKGARTSPKAVVEASNRTAEGKVSAVGESTKSDDLNIVSPTKSDIRDQMLRSQYDAILANQKSANLRPEETYSVGPRDVLLIRVNGSKGRYFPVSTDGTVDFPIAGGTVPVKGLHPSGVEEILAKNIQLYKNPQVSVSVKSHLSHFVEVAGRAQRTGKMMLQRDAMPLFVIRTLRQVSPDVRMALIHRDGKKISIQAGSRDFDEELVFSGDKIEFLSRADMPTSFATVSYKETQGKKVEFPIAMTLTKFVFLVRGGRAKDVSRVTITRTDELGRVRSFKYKLSDIARGREKDPVVIDGDVIEFKG